VVARDANSVVVRLLHAKDPFTGEIDPRGQLQQIHFEGEHYWIWAGIGVVREYFKRVESKSK
jgi:hypothetical protein